jgi:signal peptidase I
MLELARSLAVALTVILLLGAFAVVPYRVEQRSMADTLAPGDLVLVDKLIPRLGGYSRGDMVIFEAPGAWGAALRVPYVKRVIARPGEIVEIIEGVIVIDGVPLAEPYTPGPTLPTGETERWVIGEGELFVMGDNRTDSIDSRVFGPIRISSVIGRVALRYAPPSRFSLFAP